MSSLYSPVFIIQIERVVPMWYMTKGLMHAQILKIILMSQKCLFLWHKFLEGWIVFNKNEDRLLFVQNFSLIPGIQILLLRTMPLFLALLLCTILVQKKSTEQTCNRNLLWQLPSSQTPKQLHIQLCICQGFFICNRN